MQLDDAYPSGERAGGKARWGLEYKVPFVAAISLDERDHPLHLELNLVSGFTSQAIGKWARDNLTPGTWVLNDGLGCFAAVAGGGCIHVPMVVDDLKPRDLPEFRWANTVLSGLKTTLASALRSLKYRK